MGGKKGGTSVVYYVPEYQGEETPVNMNTKSLTSASTEAVQQQQERASRNRGVAASILSRNSNTTGSYGLTSQSSGNSRTLG